MPFAQSNAHVCLYETAALSLKIIEFVTEMIDQRAVLDKIDELVECARGGTGNFQRTFVHVPYPCHCILNLSAVEQRRVYERGQGCVFDGNIRVQLFDQRPAGEVINLCILNRQVDEHSCFTGVERPPLQRPGEDEATRAQASAQHACVEPFQNLGRYAAGQICAQPAQIDVRQVCL